MNPNPKERNAIFVVQEIGECVATFRRDSWSPSAGPWLMKLDHECGDIVHVNLHRYEDIVLYRCESGVPYWFLVGKQFRAGAGPTYHGLYGFNTHTIGFLGEQARTTFRWWSLPRSAKDHTKSFAFCSFVFSLLSLFFVIRLWNNLPIGTEEKYDIFWCVIAFLGMVFSLQSIRKEQAKFKEVARSL